ncbi:MAG: hypothetical protein Q8P67_10505, partial [archaeon]|nr:hypothetical protein [archaeon]
MDQSLAHVNEPQLLFRTDNMNTRFFREYISQIMTPMLLQNSLLKLTLRSLSQEHLSAGQLSAAATDLLIILEEMHLPYELTWFCAIVSSFVAKKFPGFERFGVAGLFFLRYLSPLILQFFSTYDRDAECNSKIYQRNSLIVVKLIQTMANGTAEAMTANRNDVFFSKANFDRMQAFLAKTAHKDHPQLPLTFPNVIPAPSEFDEFFQLVMRHASLIHKAIRSHGAT